MRFTASWISIFLVIVLFFLGACSSKPKKSDAQNTKVMHQTNVKPVSVNVNPTVKRDYDQALVFMKQGEYTKSEKLLKRLIAMQPNLVGPHINMGIIRLNEAAFTEAETHFKNANKLKPDNAEVYNYLGIIYRQLGRFSDAEQAYKNAIKYNPRLAKAYLNLGVLYDLYLPNYSAALENYKQYKAFDPQNKAVQNWIMDLNQRMQASNL